MPLYHFLDRSTRVQLRPARHSRICLLRNEEPICGFEIHKKLRINSKCGTQVLCQFWVDLSLSSKDLAYNSGSTAENIGQVLLVPSTNLKLFPDKFSRGESLRDLPLRHFSPQW